MREPWEGDDPDEPRWRRYLRFWRADSAGDIDDELQFHIDMRARDYQAAGHSPEEARRLAMERFGSARHVRDECEELGSRRLARQRRARTWDAARQDLRFGVRTLLRQSGFALAVIFTLALGLGANTAVFSVASGVLLDPLPFPEANRLVRLWSNNIERQLPRFSVSASDYLDWRQEARTVTGMAAFERQRDVALDLGGEPEQAEVARVSSAVFPLLGVPARLGRALTADDERPDAAPVAVLGHDFWEARFGADSSLLGRDITLDGVKHTVVGVMPPFFFVPGTSARIWTAIDLSKTASDRGNRYLRVLARLAPGATAEQATRELDLVSGRLATQNPATNRGWGITLVSVPELIVGPEFRRALFLLLGVVSFVLLIACANAASLQLARSAARHGELALRSALGASRGRLAAQLLAESLLLSVGAGAVGVLLAAGGVRLLRTFGATNVPRIENVALDGRVLGYTALLCLLTTLLFGLLPALRGSRASLIDPLKRVGRGGAAASGEGVRSTLVVVQVTLSLVLLVGAALLIQSFVRLQRVDVGFDPQRLVVAPMGLPQASYPERRMAIPFYDALAERVRGFPGVRAVALVSSPPFGGPNTGLLFAPEGRPLAANEQPPDADYRVVTPGYLRAMGIPLLRGRDFQASDDSTAPSVALISETFARRAWPGEDAVGKRLRAGGVEGGRLATVVGVVGDVRYQSLETSELRPMMYFSQGQWPHREMALVARTSAELEVLAMALRQAVSGLDRSLSAPSLFRMEERLDEELAGRRFALTLFAVFGGVALALTAIGIYGIIAYGVRQRTHEIGVRVALGAPQRAVISMVVGRALRLTAVGVVFGLGAGWLLTRTMTGLLFGVAPTHTPTFAAVAAVLALVAVVASALPARRAARVDPVAALRAQ